ncbi:MAG: CBS and ACT domain-containing protein [Treponema sp.]|jgi:acetoin utilization protein AcuB|nr:CBS and ACT domain-containing protein [Treponema sp.]
MIISRVMTKNPIFIRPDMTVNEARSLMDKEKIGHLPVLDKNNSLTGLVTRKDLLKAGPSAATSLDMYEISYLLSKMTVKEVMEKSVITVKEDEVVEEAARIMADRGVGCLPVMRGSLLVGIITDTDLFRVFVNAFGARHPGVRITCSIQEKPGQLAKLSQAIAEKGGNLVAFVSSEGDDLSRRRATLKISRLSRADAETLVKALPDVELEDIREL